MRTGVVLAGGKGSRMGAFKPLMVYEDRPLVAYAIDALASLCDEVLVMAGPRALDVSRVAQGARVFADPGEGPHVALKLGARMARGDVILTAPADAPLLRPETYSPLLEAGPNSNFSVEGTANPMVGCYRRADLCAFGGRSLQALTARRIVASPTQATQLRDLDTPDDLA